VKKGAIVAKPREDVPLWWRGTQKRSKKESIRRPAGMTCQSPSSPRIRVKRQEKNQEGNRRTSFKACGKNSQGDPQERVIRTT